MRKLLISFVSGLIFAIGLGIAGMTKPEKVIGFLDLFGDWDPSLMFVMVGAIAVNMLVYRVVIGRSVPLFGGTFQIPTRRDIDNRLVIGAALFGAGWGLMGYCPGPALVSLSSLSASAVLFVGSMFAGMALFGVYDRRVAASKIAPLASAPEDRGLGGARAGS